MRRQKLAVLGLLGLCLGRALSVRVLRVGLGGQDGYRVQWGGAGGSLRQSGFTLEGRQKPLCVQALTSSAQATPPGLVLLRKKKILSVLGGSRSSYNLRNGRVNLKRTFLRRGPPQLGALLALNGSGVHAGAVSPSRRPRVPFPAPPPPWQPCPPSWLGAWPPGTGPGTRRRWFPVSPGVAGAGSSFPPLPAPVWPPHADAPYCHPLSWVFLG